MILRNDKVLQIVLKQKYKHLQLYQTLTDPIIYMLCCKRRFEHKSGTLWKQRNKQAIITAHTKSLLKL